MKYRTEIITLFLACIIAAATTYLLFVYGPLKPTTEQSLVTQIYDNKEKLDKNLDEFSRLAYRLKNDLKWLHTLNPALAERIATETIPAFKDMFKQPEAPTGIEKIPEQKGASDVRPKADMEKQKWKH